MVGIEILLVIFLASFSSTHSITIAKTPDLEIDLASFIIGQIKDITGEVYQKKFTDTDVEDSASLEIKHYSGINSLIEISFASFFEERRKYVILSTL